jgi:hypothetical protein
LSWPWPWRGGATIPERARRDTSSVGKITSQDERYVSAAEGKVIVTVAAKLCRSVGVACSPWVADEAGLGLDYATVTAVGRVIKDTMRPSFLDKVWFWDPAVAPGRNRLDNILRKLLSVSSPIALDDVMEALVRVHSQGRLPRIPPDAAVAHFASKHPSYLYTAGRISGMAPFDPKKELSPVERIFVEVLSSVPSGLMDREALLRACTERGMNAGTFGQYTAFSPILKQLGRGVWCLRGRSVEGGRVERPSHRRPRRRSTAQAVLTGDGRLIVTWNIATAASKVFSLPSVVRSGFVDREYRATTSSGAAVGTVKVNATGGSWGYNVFLREARVVPGDSIVAEFDRRRGCVTLDVERDANRQWVGDRGDCFLHQESWALRIYVDEALLAGSAWRLPLSFADAVRVGLGRTRLRFSEDPSIDLVITRSDIECVAGTLDPVLSYLGAVAGDRMFIEVDETKFKVDRQGPADPNGDALSELLAAAGIKQAEAPRERVWSILCRAVGGAASGDREEFERRLMARGDWVSLGLLHKTGPISTQEADNWPPSWDRCAPLDADSTRFAVVNDRGERRIAIAVAGHMSDLPFGVAARQGGLVWLDDDQNLTTFVALLRGAEGVVMSGFDPSWVEWARAEHHARRCALAGVSWELSPVSDGWRGADGLTFSDLASALAAVPSASTMSAPPPEFIGPSAYPTSAYAFRRIGEVLKQRALRWLRADRGAGFSAELATGSILLGTGLADLV